jgi:hypothetical protein
MDRLLRSMGAGAQGFGQVRRQKMYNICIINIINLVPFEKGPAAGDNPMVDTAEQVYISSLALLKVCIQNFYHLSFIQKFIIENKLLLRC